MSSYSIDISKKSRLQGGCGLQDGAGRCDFWVEKYEFQGFSTVAKTIATIRDPTATEKLQLQQYQMRHRLLFGEAD